MVKKNKYDILDNLPGEVLTDIRALADQFLIAFPNINSLYPRGPVFQISGEDDFRPVDREERGEACGSASGGSQTPDHGR